MQDHYPETAYQTHCKRCGKTWDKPSQVAAHQRWCRPRGEPAVAVAGASAVAGQKDATDPVDDGKRKPYLKCVALGATIETIDVPTLMKVFNRDDLRSILKNNRRYVQPGFE